MSEDLMTVVQRLAATTGASSSDVLDGVSALTTSDPLLPEPWSEEAIVRALPAIVEMAAQGCTSVRAVAASVRAMTAQARPDEEPTT
jgi:cobalamin biosynthesis protein CbiD